jgi:hypothetical protein
MIDATAKLEEGRAFIAAHRNDPCDPQTAEDIAYRLIANLPRAEPATMRLAIAHFLANYVWGSAYNPKEAEHMLKGILKDAVETTKQAFDAEAKNGVRPANENVQPL